jgi:hypothetical protein
MSQTQDRNGARRTMRPEGNACSSYCGVGKFWHNSSFAIHPVDPVVLHRIIDFATYARPVTRSSGYLVCSPIQPATSESRENTGFGERGRDRKSVAQDNQRVSNQLVNGSPWE